MKNKFECPKLEIVLFADDDIILTSSVETADPLGDNGEEYLY